MLYEQRGDAQVILTEHASKLGWENYWVFEAKEAVGWLEEWYLRCSQTWTDRRRKVQEGNGYQTIEKRTKNRKEKASWARIAKTTWRNEKLARWKPDWFKTNYRNNNKCKKNCRNWKITLEPSQLTNLIRNLRKIANDY